MPFPKSTAAMPRRNPPGGRERSVFLNIPCNAGFQRLYLAYIAGMSAFGLVARATLEIPISERRLDRIIALIDECAYSIHDPSRVQVDRKAPTAGSRLPNVKLETRNAFSNHNHGDSVTARKGYYATSPQQRQFGVDVKETDCLICPI